MKRDLCKHNAAIAYKAIPYLYGKCWCDGSMISLSKKHLIHLSEMQRLKYNKSALNVLRLYTQALDVQDFERH